MLETLNIHSKLKIMKWIDTKDFFFFFAYYPFVNLFLHTNWQA